MSWGCWKIPPSRPQRGPTAECIRQVQPRTDVGVTGIGDAIVAQSDLRGQLLEESVAGAEVKADSMATRFLTNGNRIEDGDDAIGGTACEIELPVEVVEVVVEPLDVGAPADQLALGDLMVPILFQPEDAELALLCELKPHSAPAIERIVAGAATEPVEVGAGARAGHDPDRSDGLGARPGTEGRLQPQPHVTVGIVGNNGVAFSAALDSFAGHRRRAACAQRGYGHR